MLNKNSNNKGDNMLQVINSREFLNKNLERNNQLGAKTSSLFTEISFSPNKFLKTKFKSIFDL